MTDHDKQMEIVDTDSIIEVKGWKNAPKLTDLKADLTEAYENHSTHVTEVDAWLLAFHGGEDRPKEKNRSSFKSRLIRKNNEWRYPSLSEPFLSTEDLFNVYGVTADDVDNAKSAALVLNHMFRKAVDPVAFFDEYARTGVEEGTIVLKTGWNLVEEEREIEVPIVEQRPVTDPNLLFQLQQAGQPTVQQVVVGTETRTETITIENHPTVEICEYDDVIIDPSCKGDIDKANFVVHRFNTSLSTLEADGRYINLDKIREGNVGSPLAQPDMEVDDDFKYSDKSRRIVTVYEYWGFWDTEGDGTVKPIIVSWVDNVIVRQADNPFPDQKLPFVVVPYLPRRKNIYGEADAELLKDNQDISGAVWRGMIDLLGRSANAQRGMRRDALDSVNRDRFERGLDFEYNPNISDPRLAFYMHQYPEIPHSAFSMLELQSNEAESLTGVQSFASGISGQALGNTATGVRSALDATSKRELSILRRLAAGIKQLGRKWLSMCSEMLSDQEVVRISETEHAIVKRDDLEGDFDLILDISTAEADNARAEEIAYVMQTLGDNMPFDMRKHLFAELCRLRKMPRIAKYLAEYEPQPDPMQQQMQQLQLALLQAQVVNEQSQGRENAVDAQLKQAKTREILANADNKDLDYYERMSGAKHQQELEKEQHRTRNQMDLEAAKAVLDPTKPVA